MAENRNDANASTKAKAEPKPLGPVKLVRVRAVSRDAAGYVVTTYEVPASALEGCAVSSRSDTRPRVLASMARDIEKEFR